MKKSAGSPEYGIEIRLKTKNIHTKKKLLLKARAPNKITVQNSKDVTIKSVKTNDGEQKMLYFGRAQKCS